LAILAPERTEKGPEKRGGISGPEEVDVRTIVTAIIKYSLRIG
jgi:hypothetical protein